MTCSPPDGKDVSTGSGAYEQLIEPRHGDCVVNVVAEKLSHTGRTWYTRYAHAQT